MIIQMKIDFAIRAIDVAQLDEILESGMLDEAVRLHA